MKLITQPLFNSYSYITILFCNIHVTMASSCLSSYANHKRTKKCAVEKLIIFEYIAMVLNSSFEVNKITTIKNLFEQMRACKLYRFEWLWTV